jgi:hypothetical protein
MQLAGRMGDFAATGKPFDLSRDGVGLTWMRALIEAGLADQIFNHTTFAKSCACYHSEVTAIARSSATSSR